MLSLGLIALLMPLAYKKKERLMLIVLSYQVDLVDLIFDLLYFLVQVLFIRGAHWILITLECNRELEEVAAQSDENNEKRDIDELQKDASGTDVCQVTILFVKANELWSKGEDSERHFVHSREKVPVFVDIR